MPASASGAQSATAKPGAHAAVACEPGTCFRGRVRSSIMRRRHLDVFNRAVAIALLVFNANVRKFQVPVSVRQMTFASPFLKFLGQSVGSTRRVWTVTIGRL